MEEAANPYIAPAAPVVAVLPPPLPGDAGRPLLAGRGERLLATIIDRVLYFACFVPTIVAASAGSSRWTGILLVLGFLAAAGLFIYNLMLLGDNGQTLGKRWLNIRILRSDGSDADFGRIFGLRMFVPWVLGALFGPFFVLPDLLFIFGNEKRCLHDMMADTIVVQG